MSSRSFAPAFLLLAFTLLLSTAGRPQTPKPRPADPASSVRPEDVPESTVELEELAPPAVELDQTHASPLIRALYRATRETKQDPTLADLAEAKRLLDTGADIHATDADGRTALHWTIFGASYATRPAILVAYEEIADLLIQHGVDFNLQDAYNDTALDYLLYSPSFELQTLLLEAGATSGFLADARRLPVTTPTPSNSANLTPGKTLSIRLDAPVFSDRSRTGDPVTGIVTYPLCRSGEDITCPAGELIVAPGTRVRGTVLFAQKAPDKYWRPRLVLDFSSIVHPDGSLSPLYSRVLNVDNARETVRNNEIFGIVQPHASGKVSLALSAVGVVNPIAGYAVRGVQTVYGLSLRREILFPSGTDLQIQIVRGSALAESASWSGWPVLPDTPELRTIVQASPGRVATPSGAPSDLTNLLFIGTQQQIIAAFREAGWYQADNLNLTSSLRSVQATLRNTDYISAPVSTLLLGGKQPDLVFQKSLDTFAQRHHIRIWKQTALFQGREIWVGAATHDIAVSNARAKTRWSHRVDPHIDRERDWIQSDLLFAGTARAFANVDRPAAPRHASNATGDVLITDGKMGVVDLTLASKSTPSPTLIQHDSVK